MRIFRITDMGSNCVEQKRQSASVIRIGSNQICNSRWWQAQLSVMLPDMFLQPFFLASSRVALDAGHPHLPSLASLAPRKRGTAQTRCALDKRCSSREVYLRSDVVQGRSCQLAKCNLCGLTKRGTGQKEQGRSMVRIHQFHQARPRPSRWVRSGGRSRSGSRPSSLLAVPFHPDLQLISPEPGYSKKKKRKVK